MRNALASALLTFLPDLVADAGRGWSVAKCGPWSQGPVLLQQLRLLSGVDVELPGGIATEQTVHAQVRFDDLQHEPAGDGRVEGVAAPGEHGRGGGGAEVVIRLPLSSIVLEDAQSPLPPNRP